MALFIYKMVYLSEPDNFVRFSNGYSIQKPNHLTLGHKFTNPQLDKFSFWMVTLIKRFGLVETLGCHFLLTVGKLNKMDLVFKCHLKMDNSKTECVGPLKKTTLVYSDPPNIEPWSVFRLYLMPVPGIRISDH
jgi:hypothetical protein